MVYPLVALPGWVASRYFYNFVGMVIKYLLIPLLVAYMVLYTGWRSPSIALRPGSPGLHLVGGDQELPLFHYNLRRHLSFYALVILALFAIFFVVLRRALRRTLRTLRPHERQPHYSPGRGVREQGKGDREGETGDRR